MRAALDQVRCTADGRQSEGRYENVHVLGANLGRLTASQVELAASRLERVDLTGAQLTGLAIRDVIVERGDIANAVAYESRLTRTEFRGVRMTGASIIDSILADVLFEEVKLDLAGFRSSRFRRVEFRGCNLTRADFVGADIAGATFVDCDLSGAQFSHVKAGAVGGRLGARFTNCRLDGIGGVTSLRGASMTSHDVVGLSRVFAAELGIEIADQSDGLFG